jgi:hypothetical protein
MKTVTVREIRLNYWQAIMNDTGEVIGKGFDKYEAYLNAVDTCTWLSHNDIEFEPNEYQPPTFGSQFYNEVHW